MLQFGHMICGTLKQNSLGPHRKRQRFTQALVRAATVAAVCLLCTGAAPAQSLSSNNVFLGYSFIGANLFSGGHANLNGWNASAEKKFLPFFGVVADFSGHYGSKGLPPGNCAGNSQAECLVNSSVSEHYFQFGVRGSYATARVRPYAELLFGAVRTSESGVGLSDSKTSFAETLAAGLDTRVTRLLGWRVEAGLVKSGTFYSQQNSLRASTGLVLRF
jgi:Outer membrane protein beta-barrel domain